MNWELKHRKQGNGEKGHMALNFSEEGDELEVFSKFEGGTAVALNEYKILNLPFQFNNIADPRVCKTSAEMVGDVGLDNGGTIGRMYDKHIIANAQVLIIRPGRPKFMSNGLLFDTNSEYKAAIENELANGVTSTDPGGLDWEAAETGSSISSAVLNGEASDGLGNPLRYYDFEEAYLAYATYVTRIVRSFAFAMCNLEEDPDTVVISSGDLRKISDYKAWNLITDMDNTKLADTAGYNMVNNYFLAFYLDTGTSYGDSINNNTGESQLAAKIKGINANVREGQFLFGAAWGGNVLDTDPNLDMMKRTQKRTANAAADTFMGFGTGGTLIANAFKTTLAGGQMLFPEIWQDSTFSKDYSLSIKLSSPYGDPFSVFTHIFVPLSHLLALVLPRQNSPQGYEGPFIVKAYVRGMFSCDLGMCTGISIQKTMDSLTRDGLPTEVMVTLSLKDLYNTIMVSISNVNQGVLFGSNTGLIEYIYALSGVELYSTERVWDRIYQFINRITTIGVDAYNSVRNLINQVINTKDAIFWYVSNQS